MQLGVRRETCRLDLGDFLRQHQPQLGIFVADVEVGLRRLDDPGRDQHALDEAVWIALEIVAVLEGTGLTLVGIDREHAGRRLRAHQRPFAAGGKSSAAEAAQAGVADNLDQLVARAFAGQAILQQRVAAGLLVRGQIRTGLPGVRMLVRFHVGRDFVGGGVKGLQVADRGDRRAVAGAHAGRAHDAHVLAEDRRQFFQ